MVRVDAEMQEESLSIASETCDVMPNEEPFCIRSYRGLDELGNERQAVRAITRFGVIMALGPPSSFEAMQGETIELVPTLENTWNSSSDVNGDGLPDVVVARSGKSLEVWGLHARGASPYPIDAITPVTGAMDLDGDGRPELFGVVRARAGDPIAPKLIEVVGFSAGRYRFDTPSVRAFHARQAREKAGNLLDGESLERRIAVQVEIAWHQIRSGGDRAQVLKDLDDAVNRLGPLSSDHKSWLRRWREWLERIAVR